VEISDKFHTGGSVSVKIKPKKIKGNVMTIYYMQNHSVFGLCAISIIPGKERAG
jgi:hypothetical protein